MDQFDLFDALEKKRSVLEALAKVAPAELRLARAVARKIAREKGTVTADDVHRVFMESYPDAEWGQWAGALFRIPDFVPTGEFRPSPLSGYHGNMRRVWKLRDE